MSTSTVVELGELWARYDILIGGLGAQRIKPLDRGEEKKFDKFAEDSVNVLQKISPEIAEDFKAQIPLFRSVGEIFGAKVDKAFGGILPSSGQYGVGLIIPQDIRYVTTPSATEPAYSHYELNSWDVVLTAGTAMYLLGDGTNFYKARPTVGVRCAFVIMKNGIIEIGTTPTINQLIVRTERVNYPAFTVHALVDQTIEKGTTIYRYNFPLALPVFHDFGVMLGAMPMTSKTSNIRLFGVIFYEYDHRATLRYLT